MLRRKAFLLLLVLLATGTLVSCVVQTDNSVNGDASVYGTTPVSVGVSRGFAQASAILKKNCVPCHASDLASFTEQELVSQKYIIPGRPESSLLYERLNGANGPGGQKNMPQGRPPLSHDDLRTIHDWIEQVPAGITPTPTPSPSPTFADTAFGRAQAVILTNCATCHHHQQWNHFQESDFIAKQLVTPGTANGSLLYQRLIGANVPGVDPGDMPETGDPLSVGDLQTISTWIDQIPVVQPSPSPAPSVTPTPSVIPSPSPSPTVSVAPSPSPSPVVTPSPSPSSTTILMNASQRTAAALAVISNSCADCHTRAKTADSSAFPGAAVAAFAKFTADSDFVTAGLVSAGNPGASWLIRSLKTYGDINSMPESDDAISADDEATLTSWIAGIGQP